MHSIGRYTEGDCQQCLRLRVDAITFVGRRCGGTAQSISYVRSQLCEMCLKDGRINAATIADHIERHRVISKKFFFGELQSLCVSCTAKASRNATMRAA